MAETWEQFAAPISMMGMLNNLIKRNTVIIPNAGAPTNGTSGTAAGKAGPASLLLDYTNGQLYINTNTLASPTWSKVPDSLADLPLTNTHLIVGNASNVGVDVALSGDATLANTGAITLGAVVDGSRSATVANDNVIGGTPVIHRITVTLLTGDLDVILTNKTRILNAWFINVGAGGAGDTIIIKNGATAISDTLDCNKADKTVTRMGTTDTTQWDIAAAGTLRITGASAVNGELVVEGIRVP